MTLYTTVTTKYAAYKHKRQTTRLLQPWIHGKLEYGNGAIGGGKWKRRRSVSVLVRRRKRMESGRRWQSSVGDV